MNALHEQFIAEARELIHQATDDLIAVEREGFAPERIDRVFRAFHTLKGSAGVVDLPAMGVTLHAAEDLLAAIHAGKLEASPAIIDQALACLDQVARWVDDFEAGASLPPDAGEEARAMAGALRYLLSPDGNRSAGRIGSGGIGTCGRRRAARLGVAPDRNPSAGKSPGTSATRAAISWRSRTSRTAVASSTGTIRCN